MLKISNNHDYKDYDYICGIVERFVFLFESPLEKAKSRLSKLIKNDDNLSQDPSSKVPNIRILTTKGDIDIYFLADDSDKNLPDAHPINQNPKPNKGESCLIFAVNGIYRDYIHFDLNWYSYVIDHVVPQFTNCIFNVICSKEG